MLLSTLEYGAYLSYSPRGTTKKEIESRTWMQLIKNENLVTSNPDFPSPVPMSEFIAKRLSDRLNSLPFKDFFGKYVSLVPVPKSSLMQKGTLWVPKALVQAFCEQGLGKELDCLIRLNPVNKAASSKSTERPKANEHFKTIGVQDVLDTPKSIILVDDVITKGATLLGSANKLHQIFPKTPIKAFVVVRTVSSSAQFREIYDPVHGHIKLLDDGNTRRAP